MMAKHPGKIANCFPYRTAERIYKIKGWHWELSTPKDVSNCQSWSSGVLSPENAMATAYTAFKLAFLL